MGRGLVLESLSAIEVRVFGRRVPQEMPLICLDFSVRDRSVLLNMHSVWPLGDRLGRRTSRTVSPAEASPEHFKRQVPGVRARRSNSLRGPDHWKCYVENWGFPEIRGTFLVVPLISIIVFWGLYWGPPFWETTNCRPLWHATFRSTSSSLLCLYALCPPRVCESQACRMSPLKSQSPGVILGLCWDYIGMMEHK